MKYFVKILGDLEQDDGFELKVWGNTFLCPDCTANEEELEHPENYPFKNFNPADEKTYFAECICGSTFEFAIVCDHPHGVYRRARYL